ncbi:hypothetical protein DL96DRAFT_650003 [Flagelloscypha sp. PMI_526]|nr:hypothetical protein DL96DRAFT_650003 [Flagelloscypha sp. PMI_526]
MSPKVWLITGTSSGIGRAVTEHALSKGQIVVATARNLESFKDLKLQYPATQLLTLTLDVTRKSDIQNAFSAAIESFGRVDIVYSNSGYSVLGELESVEEDMARTMFEVNLWGAANVALEAVRIFRDVNKPVGGKLLLASSYAAVSPLAGLGYYGASKFAIDGFHEALSKEVDPSWNIKIIILQLGGFATDSVNNSLTSQPHPAYANSPITELRKLLADPEALFKSLGAKPASTAARILFDIAGQEDVPLRIPVGLDAASVVKGRADEIGVSTKYAERWDHILE